MDLEEKERRAKEQSTAEDKVGKSLEEQLRLNEELRQGKFLLSVAAPTPRKADK